MPITPFNPKATATPTPSASGIQVWKPGQPAPVATPQAPAPSYTDKMKSLVPGSQLPKPNLVELGKGLVKGVGETLGQSNFATPGITGADIFNVKPKIDQATKASNKDQAMGKNLEKIGELAIPFGAEETIPTIEKAGASLIEKAAGKTETAEQLTGKIVQGKIEDIPKAQKVLSQVDTSKIKTYADLTKALDEKVKTVSGSLDSILEKNTTVKKLNDLSTGIKIGDKTVSHNYVTDALEQLKSHFTSVNDIAGLEKINQLEAKATEKGLTVKEINDLAKLHGNTINAFNANGQAASGLTKQAAENTRTGLKTTARDIFGGSEYKALDKQISDTIRTKDLVGKVEEGVNKLKQRVTERGWGEKLGRLVFQVADKITGGGLKGFVQSFVPRGEGLKIMNALDLEKGLQKNLESLTKALSAKTEEEATTELNNILKPKLQGSLKGNGEIRPTNETNSVKTFNEIKPAENLSPEDRKVESAAIKKLQDNPQKLIEEYKKLPDTKNGKIVNSDSARRLFIKEGYKGTNAAAVQEPASALAKHLYKEGLKNEGDAFIFAGGSGTGKTSAAQSLGHIKEALDNASVVLDGNLSTIKSAEARIGEAHSAGKAAKINYVYRDPVESWNSVVHRMLSNELEMGRAVPASVVAENHIGSYNTIKDLLSRGSFSTGEVEINLIDNSLGKGNQTIMEISKFHSLEFDSKEGLQKLFINETKKLYENKTITKAQYEALIK